MKPTAPGSLSHIIYLCDLFLFAFIFGSINQKTQKYLAAIYFILRSIYQYLQLSPANAPISGIITRKGLTTPLTHRVASICYLCAGAIYVVFLGSPTGSITLVSYLREIPTAAVLHHPFIFGENNDVASSDIIYLAHDYKDRSLSKLLKRKDQTKLLFI